MLLNRNNSLEILERLKSKVPLVRVGSIIEEPKSVVPEKPKNIHGVMYHGILTNSRELAAKIGVSYITLRKLVNKGLTGEQIEERINKRKEKLIEYQYKGSSYTISSLAKHPDCVVCRRTLSHRLQSGWDLALALSTPADCGNRQSK